MNWGGVLEPFYFGKPGEMLFGAYHPPQRASDAGVGIILCYPMGQEYIRSHRAFLRLAVLLASYGYHVLRFDYFGCGDSEGDFEEAGVRQWIGCIGTAIEELQGGCGIKKTFIVGLRLGATLSIAAARDRDNIDGLVLWEPIVSGAAYIKELLTDHDDWLRGSFARSKTQSAPEPACEVLGFPLSSAMIRELETIDLLSMDNAPVREALVIESKSIFAKAEFIETLRCAGVSVRSEAFPGTEVWIKKKDEMSKSLVPVERLDCIGSWIVEASG